MLDKLLIVDDNRLSRQALAQMLDGDYELLEAASRKGALAVLRRSADSISAVLINLSAPAAELEKLLTALQSDARTAQIPVIVALKKPDSDLEAKALALGAHDFLLKPFTPALVKNRVQNIITARRSIEKLREEKENLRISEELFRIAAASGDRVIARYDIRTGIYYKSVRSLLLQGFGDRLENVPQAFIDRNLIAPECVAACRSYFDRIKSGEESVSEDIAILTADGGSRWYRFEATVIFDDEGRPSQAVIVYTDITEQLEKESVYRKWQQSLRQKAPESYAMFRCNLSRDSVPDAAEGLLLQIDFSDAAMSFDDRTFEYAMQHVLPEDREGYIAALRADTLLANYYRDNRIDTLEYREMLPTGAIRWLRLTIELVESPNSTDVEAYLLYEDIDKSKTAEMHTRELAENDPLTGVLNRTAFKRQTNQLLERSKGSQHTLMMLDIDGFKKLNDTFGHAAGDQALIDIAKSLRSVLRHGDLLGRLGGDEFVICLTDVPYDAVIEKKADQICALIRRAYSADVQISASVGIAAYPRDGEDFDALYRSADEALYRVKNSGKDNYAFFRPEAGEERKTPDQAERPAPAAISSTPAKRRMLIVDDNALSRKLLEGLFKDEFLIEAAEDGQTALKRLRHYGSSLSIVLLDLMMPGMDGFAVLEKMRESLEMRSIPVVVVTGEDERETYLRAIRGGAADYVSKPVDPELIRLRVQSAISKAESERLRAQNSYLLLQSSEEAKYRTVLDSTGTVVIEYDWVGGVFIYDPSITRHIAGDYNDRKLWHILMSDMVADAMDVKAMQELVYAIANDRSREDGSMMVKLKTPGGAREWFRMRIFKRINEFQLTDKLLITFNNVNDEVLSDAKLRFQAERDGLTGLYNRGTFFEKAAEKIARQEPGRYVMACFDINNFKVVNDQYGSDVGDAVLKQIAEIFAEGFETAGGLACRITADNFATLYPIDMINSRKLAEIRERASVLDGSIPPLSFSIGRYIVDDPSLSISAMYDRAVLAQASVKGRFDENIALYDESMRERLLHEQEIENEMRQALREHEFAIWLQPQYNHSTGALIGAEALVRWQHPVKGLVMPSAFIPVFERNGFIYEMDKYVWEQTCAMLRRWIEAGYPPPPVSVNVSRYDLFREDLVSTITGLVDRYGIPLSLLRLEITESAFAESTDHIIGVVKSLIDCGFTVEIDDFGSGYSSLNTLKDVPAQVIKLDMRFLEKASDTDRGGNILESVVRMTKWLGMSVIAEGVETMVQADYLKSIGCNYVQGYLYARPMPADQYESLVRGGGVEEKLSTLETVENLNNNAFWDPESMDTLIFNTYVGGACIFEWHNERIEILRANEKYAQILGGEHCTVADALSLNWAEHMDETAEKATREAIERTIETGDDVIYEANYFNLFGSGKTTWLRTTFRAIARAGNRYLLYATNDNLTAQREVEQKERRLAEQMQAVLDNVGSGISAVVLKDGGVEYLFVNDRYYEMHGYTEAQFKAELKDPYDVFHPDDRQRVIRDAMRANEIGRTATIEYRIIRRDGEVRWLRIIITTRKFESIDDPVQVSILTDITEEKRAEEKVRAANENLQNMMDDMPGGFVRLRVLPDGGFATEYANETYCRLRGVSCEELLGAERADIPDIVHPDDRELISAFMAGMVSAGKLQHTQCRLLHAGGGYTPLNILGRASINEAGESFVNVYFAELSEQEKHDLSLRETMPYVLSAIMRYSTDLVFAKDKDFRYICCSPAFVRFTRQKSESEVIGKTDYEFWTKEEADHFRGDDMRLFELGEPLVDYIEPIPSDDGIQHYCSTSKYVLRDSTGEIIGMYGIGRDITEERTAFEQLKLLTNNIPGGLATYEFSPEGVRITYFNDGYCGMMGYTREEYEQITASGITNLVFEEDRSALLSAVYAAINDDVPLNHSCRLHRKDGGYLWVNIRGSVTERRGDISCVSMVLFDVTEAMLAQEEILIRAEELRVAMSKLGKMICEYDPATRVLTVPESFAAQYNLPAAVPDVPDSLIAAGAISEETLPAYIAFYEAIQRGEASGSAEYCDRRADGEARWEHVEFSTIFDSEGKPVKVIIAVEDTTEQHRRYELEQSRPTLGEENLLIHALFNLNTGETLEYAYADGSAVPLAERTAFTYGGDNLDVIIDDEERERYRELNDPEKLLARYEEGETELSIDYRRRMSDGVIVWVRNLLHMVREPGGSDVLLFEYCYNIEEEKLRELMYGTLVNDNYDYVARINGQSRRFAVVTSTVVEDDLIPRSGEDFDVVAGHIVDERVHPNDKEAVRRNVYVEGIKKNLSATGHFQFTFRIVQPDGEIRYKQIVQHYLDRERDIIIMTRADVTALMQEEARKNALLEAALKAANEESRVKEREAAARLSLILNSVNGGMSATAMVNGRVEYIFANDEYFALFGYDKEEFVNSFDEGMRNLIHPADLEAFDNAVSDTETKGAAMVEVRARRRDGSLIWIRNISSSCAIEGIDAPVYIVVSNDITGEREALDNLRMSEEQFRIAAAAGDRAVSRYDIQTGDYYHRDAVLLSMGFPEKIENVPQAFIDAGNIAPESLGDYLDFYDRIKRGEKSCRLDSRIRVNGDDYRWCRQEATVVFDAEGKPSQAIIVVSDITELREKEAVYIKWQQSLQQRPRENYTLFRCNLNKDASFDSVEGDLLHMEFGPMATTFNDRTREYASRNVYPEDREAYLAFLNSDTLLANYYRGMRTKTIEFRQIQPDNSLRWLRLTVELVEYPNSSDIEAYLMYEDIDENKRDELRNKERAETDPLTGVLNRTAFAQAAEHLIAGPNAAGSLAFLMLDLDGFKLTNDTFGHVVGDQVLTDIAKTLRGMLRHGDLLGRLGGDEFLICMPDMPDDAVIENKARQICSLLYKALSFDVYVSASIGIAVYPRDGKDFDTLYRKMDAALYAVKNSGKNSFAFYHESMDARTAPDADIADLISQTKKRRLLIVDDSQVSIKMLSRMFEKDFIIETAANGAEALERLRVYGSGIAAVLLDLVMPDMDGFAVLEQMRSSIEMRTVPVIVVSGMDEYETGLKTIQCGATDYVTKPINAALLRLRVESAISKTENDRLRVQNSMLLLHNTETAKYRAALESVGAAVIEFEPESGRFYYDPAVSKHIAGNFVDGPLWRILLDAQTASSEDVERMQQLVSSVMSGAEPAGGSVSVLLKTPSGERRLFRMNAKNRPGVGDFSGRIILTFVDIDGDTAP